MDHLAVGHLRPDGRLDATTGARRLGPVLSNELDLSRTQIGLLSSAIWSGMLVTMVPVGTIIDRPAEEMTVLVGVAITSRQPTRASVRS